MEGRQVLSLLVENTPGVVSHISGLFSRRGFNIDGFSVGVTADNRYTRVTVVAIGDELVIDQIEKQLAKLEDVIDIKKLSDEDSVTRELILIKLRALPKDRQAIFSTVEIFRAKIIDVGKSSIIIEMTGDDLKINAFLDLMSDYEVLELARTGMTGLTRGDTDVTML